MRKYLITFLLLLGNQLAFAQLIERDFFGDLQFQSRNEEYRAFLKRDIFDHLTFTDSHDNKITFEKKYIDEEYGDMLDNDREEAVFFRGLIREYSREWNYKATYSIDIFDKLIIKDNRNNRLEMGKDIFGNTTREETVNGRRISITRGVDGGMSYASDEAEASIKQNIFDQWIYEDSRGNNLKFSPETWGALKHRYGGNEAIFIFLTNEFLFQ